MKTLAELRAQKPTGRAKSLVTLCIAPDLVAETHSLTTELGNLPAYADDDEVAGPPQKLGDQSAVVARQRAAQIRARLGELLEEMAEYEGNLWICANLTDGEWRRWVNEHPARGEDDPGYDRDLRVTSGVCNADDLIDNLGKFVHEWNGEPVTAEDWADIFEPVVGSGDLAEIASKVVYLYEGRLNFPQWRAALSTSLKKLNDYSSPAPSESPTSDSTDGSPDLFTAATTETESK